jgi:hypothetical protein
MNAEVPRGRRQADDARGTALEVEDAELVRVPVTVVIHRAVEEEAARRRSLHRMGERHAVRAEALGVREVVELEAVEVGAEDGDERPVVEPHHVRLALVHDLGRAEAQRREAADLFERARVVEQQRLGEVAEEADRAARVELRGVPAGEAVEELHVDVPAIVVGRAAQARHAAEALEAVEAVAVEGDQEVEGANRAAHRGPGGSA